MKKYFSAYIWFYLFLNIIVILDGALVRATNSGAGCGAYWPLCQGSVLPDLSVLNTLIEFTHRVGSGVIGIGALVLVLGAFLLYPIKHLVRRGALFILLFVILEALLGAALVLFGLVENNTSAARIWMMALHLTNTFLLLASIALTAGWAGGFVNSFLLFKVPQQAIRHISRTSAWVCLILLLLTGVTGALTALSDTLFKPTAIAQNLYEDFFAPAHILQMLRMFHPFVALVTSGILGYIVSVKSAFFSHQSLQSSKSFKVIAVFLLVFIVVQIVVGMSNLLFFTPIVLQLVHLFIADILWILSVLYFTKLYELRCG